MRRLVVGMTLTLLVAGGAAQAQSPSPVPSAASTERLVVCVVLAVPAGSALTFADVLRSWSSGAFVATEVADPSSCEALRDAIPTPDPTLAPSPTLAATIAPSPTPDPWKAAKAVAKRLPIEQVMKRRNELTDTAVYLEGTVVIGGNYPILRTKSGELFTIWTSREDFYFGDRVAVVGKPDPLDRTQSPKGQSLFIRPDQVRVLKRR